MIDGAERFLDVTDDELIVELKRRYPMGVMMLERPKVGRDHGVFISRWGSLMWAFGAANSLLRILTRDHDAQWLDDHEEPDDE